MIKIGLVSDLHSEFWSSAALKRIGGKINDHLALADIILLPGDIGNGRMAIDTARALFPDKPVCMIAGNHEFYQNDYETVLTELQSVDNIHFLHMSVVHLTVNDTPVRIIGTTLWTDFDLYGTPDLSMLVARKGLNDFRLIRFEDHVLNPQDTVVWHRAQRDWITQRLDEVFEGVTILMTHHAPVSFGVHPRFVNDPLTPCFCSRMEQVLLRDDLPLVVWGHTHHCVDRTIGSTRFVSNQTGYPSGLGTETGEFGQIIELAFDKG